MARLCWVAILATTGCSTVFGLGDPQPAPPDAPPASCAIAGFDLCAHQQPNGPIMFGADTIIDTALDCNLVLFDPQGGSVCVIYASDLTIGASVRAHGPRPLVLAATGRIEISGTVDVSSGAINGVGAGADYSSCAVKQPPGVDSGGAAGGSFHGKGGTGGNGGTGASMGGVAADALAAVDIIRGGCPGGSIGGGTPQSGDLGAGGGASGGAVAIISAMAISITTTGRVFASGQGGQGSHDYSNMTILGAAGGGSGGLVELVAPNVTIAGVIVANGGGGGEGTDGPGVKPGKDGADGTQTAQPAAGGAGGGNGGDGGSGSAGTTLAGAMGANGGGAGLGGGGGGGGAGFIVITSPMLVTTGATISPPSS